jgi:hypothetical protein
MKSTAESCPQIGQGGPSLHFGATDFPSSLEAPASDAILQFDSCLELLQRERRDLIATRAE